MKTIFSFLFITTIVLASCNNKQTTSDNKTSDSHSTPDLKTEFAKLNDFLKQYEEPSQIFKVRADKPTKVAGKQGTIISINPANLETENGQPLGKNLEVELKELINQEQLLKTNAQTTSDGQLLVSGGAYFINITSEGQPLKLKEGKTLSVEFPKITSNEMSLFYGQRDTLGQLNWQQAEQKFESNPTSQAAAGVAKYTDTLWNESAPKAGEIDAILGYLENESKKPLTEKEKKAIAEYKKNAELENKAYKAIELTQLGWINCDRFYEVPNKTNLKYVFNSKDSIVGAKVFLVFKDINSIMTTHYYSYNGKEYNTEFQNIPIGAKTQLVVFSIKEGKIYTYKSDLTLKANETVQLIMQETSEDEVEKLFKMN